jgi:hypothetical protein
MIYEAWRISYQDSEQAARAAYGYAQDMRKRADKREEELRAASAECDQLLSVLKDARACLEVANSTPGGPITDTIWLSGYETLFDFIDAALEKVGAGGTAFHIHEAPIGEGGGTAPSDGTWHNAKVQAAGASATVAPATVG